MRYLSPPKYLALYAKVFLEPLICLIVSVRFKFYCYSLLSIEKTFPCLFIHCFFIVILENSAPFLLNFCSPMTYFSKDISSHIAPSPQLHPPKPKNNPLKTTVHFPITIIICKHWSKFVTCSPSPRNSGGLSHSQRHSFVWFLTMRNKMAISKFWSVDFGETISVGGGLGALQFFGHLKRALELFISVRMSPLVTF